MKIRNGFVSNSSSSSFIIGSKEELNKKKLIELFKVDKKSPLYSIVEKMAEVLIENATELTKEAYIEDTGREEDEFPEIIKNILDKGFYLYTGGVSDDNGGVETALCGVRLDYEDDEFIIEKEEGY